MDSFRKVRAIDVRNEVKRHVAFAVAPEAFVGHSRAQVRPADADVNDSSNALPGVAPPRTTAEAITEISNPAEHGVDSVNDVLSIDHNGRLSGSTEGDV